MAVLTREEKIEGREAWRPTGWVSGEYISARGRDQRAIAIIEAGVEINGPYAENERIALDRTAPREAIIRLLETIGLWKLNAGRSLEIRLLPDGCIGL